MELRVAKAKSFPPPPVDCSLDVYFWRARELTSLFYGDTLNKYKNLDWNAITPEYFWSEFCWAVYVSGFNSKVISSKIAALQGAYGKWTDSRASWDKIAVIIRNKRKYEAIETVRELLQKYFEKDAYNGWRLFKQDYLLSVEQIQKLPFMGPVTSQHLARNLGLNTVKPDLHLTRLAKKYGFRSPLDMCNYLAREYNEKIGIIDLILFYGASTWGSKNTKRNIEHIL